MRQSQVYQTAAQARRVGGFEGFERTPNIFEVGTTVKRLLPVDYTDDYLPCQDYRMKPQHFGIIMRSSNLLDWLIDVRFAFHPCRGACGNQK